MHSQEHFRKRGCHKTLQTGVIKDGCRCDEVIFRFLKNQGKYKGERNMDLNQEWQIDLLFPTRFKVNTKDLKLFSTMDILLV